MPRRSKNTVSATEWRIELFGEIAAVRGSVRLTKFSTKHTAGLLAMLARAYPAQVTREAAAACLWGDGDRQVLRNRLSQAVSTLRRMTGSGSDRIIVGGHFALRIEAGKATVDVAEFEQTVAEMDAAADGETKLELATKACALYKGDYLAGYHFPWADADRLRLRAMFLHALDVSVAVYEEQGKLQRAADVAYRLLHAEPTEPRYLARLCRLLGKCGRTGQASQLLAAYEARLPEGQPLDPELHALKAELGALPCVPKPHVPTGQGAATFAPCPPPAFATEIVGRQTEIGEIRAMLARGDTGPVTVTGLGGSGKTRLAAALVSGPFAGKPDWVAWANLGPQTGAATVLGSIGKALGMGDARSVEELSAAVSASPIGWLVLDEAEGMSADEVGQLDAFLAMCPGLRLLVTSRVPLKLQGEEVYPLQPLRVKKADNEACSPAAQLFLQSARRANKSLDADPAVVDELCERLDGLPLSIELASGWVRVISVPEIVERVQEHSELLQDSSVPASARHASLGKVVGSTLELASEHAREFMVRAAAFEGPVRPGTLERAVGSGSLQSLLELEGLGVVQFAGFAGERTMVAMLSSISRLVRERWTDEEQALATEAHRRAMLGAALREGSDEKIGEEQWIAETEAQLADHVAAVKTSVAMGLGEDALRHAIAISILGETGTSTLLCTELLEAALSAEGARPETRLLGKVRLARLLWIVSEYARSKEIATEQLALAQEMGDVAAEVAAASILQVEAHRVGDYATSEALLKSNLDASLRRGDHADASRCWLGLGNLAMERTQWDQAETDYVNALREARAAGARNRSVAATVNLAYLALATQRYRAAAEFARRALDLVGGQPGYARLAQAAHAAAVHAHVALGDAASGLESLRLALEPAPSSGRALLEVLTAAADVAASTDKVGLAAQILGFIDGFVAAGENPGGLEGARRAAIAAQCASMIGGNEFESYYMAGGTVSPDQALEMARQVSRSCVPSVV